MSGRTIGDIMARVYDVAGKPRFMKQTRHRRNGTKVQRAVRNTVEYTRRDGTLVYRLHNTDIVTMSQDRRTVTLDTGGWNTVTTRDRMSLILKHLGLIPPGVYGAVFSVYGARALCFRDAVFTDSLTIHDGVPVVTEDMLAEADSARMEQVKARRETARHNRENRKRLDEIRFANRHGFTKADYREWLKQYRAAVKACAKVSARRITKTRAKDSHGV